MDIERLKKLNNVYTGDMRSNLTGTEVKELIAELETILDENERLQKLAVDLAKALSAMQVMSHHHSPRKLDEALTWRQNDMKAHEMCETALANAKHEGVIE